MGPGAPDVRSRPAEGNAMENVSAAPEEAGDHAEKGTRAGRANEADGPASGHKKSLTEFQEEEIPLTPIPS